MLNYPTQSREDKELLKATYEALQNKECVEIITDSIEAKRVFREIANSLSFSTLCAFSIANLFKTKSRNGSFYIAQCFQDFRFSVKKNGIINDEYHYRLFGFAELSTDFGKIILRPETKSDRVVGKFFRSDIEIENANTFNERYYLAANDSEKAQIVFNSELIKMLTESSGVHLTINDSKLLIFVESEMTPAQIVMIEKILFAIQF